MRYGLIEQGQRVANGAFRRARDRRQRLGFDPHPFEIADFAQMRRQLARVDAAQIETLAARAHRDRHLVDFGGGEDEFDVFGRLFQRLQQAVEGGLREHVHFVDDVDLGARHHRAVAGVVDDLANIVDAGVRGGVHLQHVDVPRFDDRPAMDAKLPHVNGRTVDGGPAVRRGQFIVEGARQNARGRRLADAAHPRQEIGLMDAVEVEGVLQRAHHRLLADEVGKARWAIFAREHAISGRRTRGVEPRQRKAGALRGGRRLALLVHQL